MNNSIAIIGSGIVCAIGTDKQQVRESLLTGKTGIGELRYLKSRHKELPVGEVKMSDADLKNALAVSLDREFSRTALLGAYALRQAIEDAGLSPKSLKGKRVTLISGTTVGGTDIAEQYSCGNNTRAIARLVGIDCEVTTISTACSSALNAIILGVRMLLWHETDIVLAGGTEALSMFHLNGFNSLMILDHNVCRPFDATRQGLNLGEGAAYLILERTEDARLRERNIQGYITGWGNRCDAYHQTATSENGEGAFLAMTDALQIAHLQPNAIDYVNAHGTGTPDNDKSESTALRRVFANKLPPISSTKSFTGHTTSASGSIEAVICLIAMQGRFIPGNYGWENSTAECIVPAEFTAEKDLHHVLCNSFGFGGNDSSLVISDRELPCCPHREEPSPTSEYTIAGENEITQPEELKELSRYLPSMETRRMCKITKAAFLTSIRVMETAGITSPDAIIIATQYGMLENGGKILDTIQEQGEEGISPTLFMQSTHNTLAGALAIHFDCHGYNITYSQGEESLQWAIRDAKRLICEGKAKNVLVGLHNEMPPKFKAVLDGQGLNETHEIYSKSIIVKSI
ncbi:MAG: beta-ketoacyl synthase chain length factor [Bacteroidaceae bacterium]|nr:beta-ketoacyl synthase chain length factor [Bacteroidaceae bacterium]